MIARALGRLSGALVAASLVLAVAFLLLAGWGDPAGLLDDPSLSAEDRARVEGALGLDRAPLERLAAWCAALARGDLGVSLSRQRPVSAILAEALAPTLLLSGTALAVALLLGLSLGTRAALRPGGASERVVGWVLPALDATPPFFLGLLAVLVFASGLGWLPASHMASAAGRAPWWGGGVGDLLAHLVLPAAVIAIPGAAPLARHHWLAMRRELASPHARLARAAGLPPGRLAWRWAFRASLQPTIALVGLALPGLVGGALVVEIVFAWPGLGRVQQQALLARDVPLALGALLLTLALVLAGALLADAAAAWADPRLRRRGAGEGAP